MMRNRWRCMRLVMPLTLRHSELDSESQIIILKKDAESSSA